MNFKAFRQWVILLLMIVVGVTVFFLYNINIDSKSNRQPAQIISSVANSTSIDSLQPGEWYEIPNSKIRQSLPSPIPVGNPSNITNAWNGGFFDSTRNRYVVMGGGHADYAGNEMYGFDVNSLTWSRFWGPTPNAQIPTSTGTYEVYDDGNPGSRHTYGGLVYLPNIDKYFVHGGSLYYSGNGSSKVWLFNPAGGTWSQGTTPSGNCTVNELVNQAAYDPGTGKVLVHLYNHLCEYDPIGNAWTKRGDGGAGFSFGNHAAVYDYDHKYYCFITNGVWCYNLNDSSTATPLTRVTTSGDIGIESAGVAGADYDPVSKKIVAWVGGTSVYTLDITTSRWTKLSAATGNTVTPTSPTSNGTFGRWRYVPSKNAFIVVNSIDDNVYMYKLSSGSGVPQVTDVTPPSTPGGLVASNLAQTTLTLNWNVSIDNVGVTGYKVFKAGIQIGTPTTNSFAVTGLTAATAYSFTVSASDTVGNNSTLSSPLSVTTLTTLPPPTPTPVPVPTSSGQINISTGVFTALALPDNGVGIQSNKHISLELNPLDGRIYQIGGDFTTPDNLGFQSYQQSQFSFSVADRFNNPSNKNAGWRKEYIYCGVGGVQPKHPDFVGWTWDSKRSLFWMIPGTMVSSSSNCSGETVNISSDTAFRMHEVMTYNPFHVDPAQRWKVVTTNPGPNFTDTWRSTYDPITDTIIRFGYNGSVGGVVDIYNIASNSWSTKNLGQNSLGQDIRVWKQGTAFDPIGRVIYTVDGIAGKLFRYHIDTQVMEEVGSDPLGPVTIADVNSSNDNYVAWDSVNKLLYHWHSNLLTAGGGTLEIYHPDTGQWELPPMTTSPAGMIPETRHGFFYDPSQNVLILMGSTDTSNLNMFLYRYANSTGTTLPPPTPVPPPPTSTKFVLNDRVSVTALTLNVRFCASSSCAILGTQGVGVLGTVVAGPTYIDGFSWWNINYDSGIDGWSVEDYVTKYVSTTPPPDPSPVPTPPPVPTPSSQLKIGSQVISTNNLKSRFCASIQCRGLGVHKKGEIGEVIDGPQYADNYNWYKIDFQTGVDGWSVENYIAVIKSLVINDRFYTIANLKLRLCPSLSCALISIQKAGLHGVVMDGPVTADNYNWYKIKYDSGLEGWSIGNYLVYE